MFDTTKSKKKIPVQNYEDQIERFRDFAGGVTNTVKDELHQARNDAWDQIWGLEKQVNELSGELKAGESLDLTQGGQANNPRSEYPNFNEVIAPGYEYHRPFAKVTEARQIVKEDTRQIQIRVDQIIMELKKLANSSQELEIQFREVTMEVSPVDPGTYHLNFFEWVFGVIQKARERIEESQTWITLFKSKKKQKGYWNMFKKHGTTFGLSGERVVATQTG